LASPKAPIFFFHGSIDIRLMVDIDYCLVVGGGASPGEPT
jgi:hypothetical protein